MTPSPDFAEFADLATRADHVPVWRELLFDRETAVSAYWKLAEPPFGFLLESVEGGERWGRYTFLGTEPEEAWRLDGGSVSRWTPEGGWGDAVHADDPLADFRRWVGEGTPAEVPGMPPFWGGAVGYFGYDIVRHLERLPGGPAEPADVPDALFLRTGVVLAIDNLFGTARAIVTVDTRGLEGPALERAHAEAHARIDRFIGRLEGERRLPPMPAPPAGEQADIPFESSMTRPGFEAAVRRIQEYILAGDAFQVVLSQRLTVPLESNPFQVYRALRSLNPSPYLFYLDLDGVQLVGSSPEVLVRVQDGRMTVRPIAGTRRRGATEREDEALAADLLADPKERAEHLMLLDLGRNDVGRVCRPGSVTVRERMAIECYSHVLHMVSTVEGDLADGVDPLTALAAGFPAGTVSGAPKIRAMEIIDELEPVRRGAYAGAVGYVAHGGRSLDTAIAIRTLVAVQNRAHVQAGAGVVADSDPGSEYEETLSKARALLAAVRRAE
jgi:anthranilate synthase component I